MQLCENSNYRKSIKIKEGIVIAVLLLLSQQRFLRKDYGPSITSSLDVATDSVELIGEISVIIQKSGWKFKVGSLLSDSWKFNF